ncbi:MAG: hypothetical protein ISR52_03170 [Rhodospirillales bacterium]|nr:hypothetical protein [Rhodospirillales bacterium]
MRKIALITSAVFIVSVMATGFATTASAECAGHKARTADMSTHVPTLTQTAQTPKPKSAK